MLNPSNLIWTISTVGKNKITCYSLKVNLKYWDMAKYKTTLVQRHIAYCSQLYFQTNSKTFKDYSQEKSLKLKSCTTGSDGPVAHQCILSKGGWKVTDFCMFWKSWTFCLIWFCCIKFNCGGTPCNLFKQELLDYLLEPWLDQSLCIFNLQSSINFWTFYYK